MLRKILFALLWIPIKAISYLPMGWLYLLGDIIAGFLYFTMRYRRKVVRENLQKCFPEFSGSQLKRIEKKYYRHLGMLLVEFWKQLTAGQDFYRERVELLNFDQFKSFQDSGRSVLIAMGHVNSWEWALQRVVAESTYPFYTLYRPLKNRRLDSVAYRVRTRYGADVVDMHQAVRYLIQRQDDVLGGCFIADQNPPKQNAIWSELLGRETAFFSGFQKLARRFNHPVFYLEVKRVRRGRYRAEFRLMADSPAALSEQELTDRYAQFLSSHIRIQPESWLWSHRRWKYEKNHDTHR